jgi:protein disulfide-isomerase
MLKGAYYGAFPPEKPSPENLPAWRASYAAALEESGRTGKRVLIDFTASWCPPCRVMEAEVWPDEKVRAAIAQHVIPLQLDIDEPDSNAAARKYGIQSIPTLVIVDAHGTELARGNFMSASGVVAFVTENAGSGS